MVTSSAARGHDDGYVRLAASRTLHADPDRVAAIIGPEASTWLGPPLAGQQSDAQRRHTVDVRLRIGSEGAGLTTFRKAAYLDLGAPMRVPGGWEVEIGWRAAWAAPLFPVFSGRIRIGPREIAIEGLYAPPGGVLGRVADRLLLHIAANGTARWLLDEIDRVAREPAAA
jgi:hypothetical protein